MRKLFFLFFIFQLNAIDVHLTDTARREAMGLLIAVIDESDTELHSIAQIMARNLERSGQFKVTVRSIKNPETKEELNAFLDKRYPLEIFLSHADNRRFIAWRLYDVHDAQLIKGMKYTKRGTSVHGYADNVTDELWPVLTKQASSFSSKIAYVKRKSGTTKRAHSVVCIANTDGTHEHEIIKKAGTYMGLYWHPDKHNPCLFCSECTRFNVRFIKVTPQGRKKIVLDLKGTCVGINVSPDDNKVVYCRSGALWEYTHDPVHKRSLNKRIIKNEGKNVSPTLLKNGDIIFCSDAAKIRRGHPHASGPQICRYHAQDGSISLITTDGWHEGPSYCAVNEKIAFSKRINGVMQVCVYDCRTRQQQQLTFDAGNKMSCCWSPCGNFLAFCCQQGRESRIAVMHVVMRKHSYITPSNEHCSWPSWSPVY